MLLPYRYSITILILFSSSTTSNVLPSQLAYSQIPLLERYQHAFSLQSAAENANHIFNTIHSALRQFGSSYHHNGMSIFPATVPAGITLYHGTHDKERVVGMEWLAFEIEHAENFARSFGRPPKDRDREPDNGDHPREPPENHPRQLELVDLQLDQASDDPSPPRGPPRGPPGGRMGPGYLHVYRTNRALNLAYVDGMGAAKSSLGTLDTQDVLLLNRSSDPMREMERAKELCALPKLWNIPIDGFIRMEAGFEIIHCDFSSEGGLDFVEARKRPAGGGGEIGDHPEGYDLSRHFEYMRAVSTRYNGIGASRIELSFEKMISAYFYPINLTNPDPEWQALPRLPLKDVAQLDKMRQDLKNVLSNPIDKNMDQKPKGRIDWQGMVDMIVTRYTGRLQYIASNPGYSDTLAVLNVLLNTFVDYEDFNKTKSIEECAGNYFTPAKAFPAWSRQDYLLGTAILHVSRKICNTLFDVRDELLSDPVDQEAKALLAAKKVTDLITYLDWSTWRECGKCAYNEVCFISMWPFGGREDHFHPACKNRTSLQDRPMGSDYWRW